MYRAVLADFPATAIPGQPANLSWMASQSGGNLVAWDENSLMYQDDGTSTPAVNDGDRVWRWYPSTEIGVSGNYFRARSSAERPARNTSILNRLLTFAGSNLALSLGAFGIGNTQHFAEPSDSWMTAMYTLGSGSFGTVFSRGPFGGDVLATWYTAAFANAFRVRGLSSGGGVLTPLQNGVDREGVHGSGWDGTYHTWMAGHLAERSDNIGASANSAEPFLLAQHTSPYAWGGSYGRVVMVDAYDNLVFEKMRDWCLGVVTNQIRDPAGTPPPPPTGRRTRMVI